MEEIKKLVETWKTEKGSFIPNAPIYGMFIQELKDAIERQEKINISDVKGRLINYVDTRINFLSGGDGMKSEKNLEKRKGFKNRHTDGLPTEKVNMKVVTNDVDGEHIMLCQWKPFNKEEYKDENMPSDGYLGTVIVIEGQFNGIGFHAWSQNNSEFVYYSELN